jgi:hypothetical protein
VTSKPLSEMTEAEAKAEKRRAERLRLAEKQNSEALIELDAMRQVFGLLHPLGEDATMRVLTWVKNRIGDFPRYLDDEVPF